MWTQIGNFHEPVRGLFVDVTVMDVVYRLRDLARQCIELVGTAFMRIKNATVKTHDGMSRGDTELIVALKANDRIGHSLMQ